jgi:hypothetical protein
VQAAGSVVLSQAAKLSATLITDFTAFNAQPAQHVSQMAGPTLHCSPAMHLPGGPHHLQPLLPLSHDCWLGQLQERPQPLDEPARYAWQQQQPMQNMSEHGQS